MSQIINPTQGPSPQGEAAWDNALPTTPPFARTDAANSFTPQQTFEDVRINGAVIGDVTFNNSITVTQAANISGDTNVGGNVVATGNVSGVDGTFTDAVSVTNDTTTRNILFRARGAMPADVVFTNDANFASLGISFPLIVGKYLLRTLLQVDHGGGGFKVALNASGGLVFSSFIVGALHDPSGPTIKEAESSGEYPAVGYPASTYGLALECWLDVTVAGTLTIQGAQQAANAAPTTFFESSWAYALKMD